MKSRHHKNWQLWLNWLAYLVIVYACIPNRVFAHVRYGEDPSWQFALNTAIKNHYEFGTEFIFTYGPLGYLSSALPLYIADHGFSIILYKVLLVISLAALGIYAFNKSQDRWERMAIVLVFLLAGRLYYYESSLYFMNMFLALLLWHQHHKKNWILYAAFAFAAINIFIKLNTGFVLFVLLAMYSIILLVQRSGTWWRIMLLWLLSVILVVIIALVTHTNLSAYFKNSREILMNFSDAQTYAEQAMLPTLLLALGTILAFAVFFINDLRQNLQQLNRWIKAFMVSLCLFIGFKQGFMRGSFNHQISFFGASLVLLLVVFSLYQRHLSYVQKLSATGVVFFCLFGIVKIGIFGFFARPLKDLYAGNETRITYLPERIINQIGEAGIDLLPFESMHLFYNDLNYQPRPIPQGYQAYSYKLDSINAAYFYSERAPQYVLLGVGSIDNRAPFWDEYKTKLSIRANYTIIDSVGLRDKPELEKHPYWLLKRNDSTHQLANKIISKQWQQDFTDTISCSAIPIDALLSINFSKTWWGKLKSIIFQPDRPTIHILYDDNSADQYKAISSILSAGIPVDNRLQSAREIENFLLSKKRDRQIQPSKIWFSDVSQRFKPKITLQLISYQAQQ